MNADLLTGGISVQILWCTIEIEIEDMLKDEWAIPDACPAGLKNLVHPVLAEAFLRPNMINSHHIGT